MIHILVQTLLSYILYFVFIAQSLGDYGDTMKQIVDFKDAMVG